MEDNPVCFREDRIFNSFGLTHRSCQFNKSPINLNLLILIDLPGVL